MLLILAAVFLVKNASAASYFTQKNEAIKQGGNQENWLSEALGSNGVATFVGFAGDPPPAITDGRPLIGKDGHPVVWIPGGMMGMTNNMIAKLQTPQASGIEYIADTWNSFLGKPAYAATGTGFMGFTPLLPLWRGFRNVTYILASIIFVFVGIMIMLRIKISPQAVISIQNAIPQIITTLILITFSYAIAGLIIDASYLFQAIVVALMFNVAGRDMMHQALLDPPVISASNPTQALGNLISWVINGVVSLAGGNGAYLGFRDLANPSFNTFRNLVMYASPSWISSIMIGGLLGAVVTGTFLAGLGSGALGAVGGDITNIIGNGLGGAVGGVLAGVLMPLVISIITAIWLIKLYFGMLKAYITILFAVILAPLRIGLGAMPGSKGGFSEWFWDLLSNVAIFPVTTLFLVILNMIIAQFYQVGINMWAPGQLFTDEQAGTWMLAGMVGLGGLAMLSKLPDLVPQAIFQLKPSPFGSAIGENVGGAAAMAVAAPAAISGVYGKAKAFAGKYGEVTKTRAAAPGAKTPDVDVDDDTVDEEPPGAA
jgi:hypothetical protein